MEIGIDEANKVFSIFSMVFIGSVGIIINYITYTSIERVASKIDWKDIVSRFKVKKKFKSVMRSLESKELVSSHGKSGKVVSLTKAGVDYAYYLKNKRSQ